MADFTTIGVPIDSVGRIGGTELAPEALRRLGGGIFGSKDAGDLPVRIRGEGRDPDTGLLASDDVIRTTGAVRQEVAELVLGGERPFVLGGCCTLLPGALAGTRDALGPVGLAYLDGHLDLYDGETSPTGEAADMPVGVVLGRGPKAWVDAAGGAAAGPKDVVVVGYRDLEESKRYGMVQPERIPGLTHLSNEGVRSEGAAAAGTRVAERLASSPGRYWLHLDVDVLDEEVFPATDYLMPGGLVAEELIDLMGPLVASPALVGASVACYNPEKDPAEASGRLLIDLWRRAFATTGDSSSA
jgi:arginase